MFLQSASFCAFDGILCTKTFQMDAHSGYLGASDVQIGTHAGHFGVQGGEFDVQDGFFDASGHLKRRSSATLVPLGVQNAGPSAPEAFRGT